MADRTIAVAVNVHKEPPAQVQACFSRIRKNLPAAVVGVFLNGDCVAPTLDVCAESGFCVFPGPNFGTNRTWILWWLRMLLFFRAVAADVCFKLDPDTMVDASPRSIPDADYFGALEMSELYGIRFVQGGVTGLSSRTVSRALDANLFASGAGKPWIYTSGSSVLADDQHLAVALATLGIYPVTWPECLSRWRIPVAEDPLKHAIVHPRYYR